MRGSWRPQLFMIAVSALLLLTNLGETSLWDIDEPRNAGCAADMLAHGEWIVPTFNGELRSHKPVLLYWLMMSAYAVFGVNEFAARFWSAVLSIGTVLATYHLGCRLFNRSIGLWAGVVLATSLNFVVIGRAATPDAAFLFFTTLALALFATATLPTGEDVTPESARRQPSWRRLTLVYMMMALAVLTKGPVGVVLPTSVMVLWTFWNPRRLEKLSSETIGIDATRWRRIGQLFSPTQMLSAAWSLKPLTALAVLCTVALPWYVAVGVRTEGRWLAEFLGQHNLGRFLTPMENHRGPIFYYVLALAMGFLPWSLMIGLTLWQQIQRLRQRHQWNESYRYLACWVGVFFVFFSIATTKLPHYMIPIYPALALLTAATVHSIITGEAPALARWLPVSAGLLMLVGVGFLVGLPLAARRYFPGDEVIGLVGLAPLVGGAICLVLLRRERVAAAMQCFAAFAVILLAVMFGFLQQRIDRHQHSIDIVETIRRAGGDDATVAAFRYLRPSWVFYYGRPIVHFTERGQVQSLFADSPNAFLILQDHDLAGIESSLPPDVVTLGSVPKFLKRGRLVILGRAAAGARLAIAEKSQDERPQRH